MCGGVLDVTPYSESKKGEEEKAPDSLPRVCIGHLFWKFFGPSPVWEPSCASLATGPWDRPGGREAGKCNLSAGHR